MRAGQNAFLKDAIEGVVNPAATIALHDWRIDLDESGAGKLSDQMTKQPLHGDAWLASHPLRKRLVYLLQTAVIVDIEPKLFNCGIDLDLIVAIVNHDDVATRIWQFSKHCTQRSKNVRHKAPL